MEITNLSTQELDIYYLDNLYYQKLGEVWDHETKDFKVFYKPLYSCAAKPGSYEAHALATSTFERWTRKFIPISQLPSDHLLPEEISRYLVSKKAIEELTQGSSSSKDTIPFSSLFLNGSITNSVISSSIKSPALYGLSQEVQLCQSISGYGTRAHQPYHAIHFDSQWKDLILSGKKQATTRILCEETANGGEPYLQDLVERIRRCGSSNSKRGDMILVQAVCDTHLPAAAVAAEVSPLPFTVFATLRMERVVEYSVQDLPLEVALIENFTDLPSFLACLRGYYPTLSQESRVHVFHFQLHPSLPSPGLALETSA
jgi:hypothetical protein